MSLSCTLYVDAGDNPGAPYLELGRNWDLLNFLLTGSREPADPVRGFLVSDFVELAGEAHQIPAGDVALIAAAMVAIRTDEVLSDFDPARLNEAGVYDADLAALSPGDYSRELRGQIEDLKRFLTSAAEGSHSVIRVVA